MNALQSLIETPPIAPIIESPWYVVLTEPQRDLKTVERLHELKMELFVPVVRRRIKTGRIGKNGHKVTRVIAKPMFPGYGFLRETDTNNPDGLVWRDREGSGIRGVREFMRDENKKPIRLPHVAVMLVFQRQNSEHQKWMQETGGRRGSQWKAGDTVRIDQDGGAYAGLVAKVEWANAKGNIGVLLGMIKHELPAEMVVAA